ncbi:MAG: hypothetical protein ACK4WF_07885, partial [Candidatus Brocadiales bacterium]
VTGGTFLSLTDTPSSYTGQAKKLVRVNAAGTALEFLNELDSLTIKGGVNNGLVLDSFGQVNPKGTADAINTVYESYDFKLTSSSWRSGAEVKRTWTIINVGHTTTDYLRIYSPDVNNFFEFSRASDGRTFNAIASAGDIQWDFVRAGTTKFQIVAGDLNCQFIASNLLRFFGDSIERLNLDTNGSRFFGPVKLDNILLKEIGTKLKIRDATDTSDVILEADFLPMHSRARAKRTADESIPDDGLFHKVSLNGEDYDTLNEFDSITNYRFTAQNAGGYLVTAYGVFLANGTGYRALKVFKNGTIDITGDSRPNTGTLDTRLTCSSVVQLAAGDYLELWARQTSGGNLNLLADSHMSVTRLW